MLRLVVLLNNLEIVPFIEDSMVFYGKVEQKSMNLKGIFSPQHFIGHYHHLDR